MRMLRMIRMAKKVSFVGKPPGKRGKDEKKAKSTSKDQVIITKVQEKIPKSTDGTDGLAVEKGIEK